MQSQLRKVNAESGRERSCLNCHSYSAFSEAKLDILRIKKKKKKKKKSS